MVIAVTEALVAVASQTVALGVVSRMAKQLQVRRAAVAVVTLVLKDVPKGAKIGNPDGNTGAVMGKPGGFVDKAEILGFFSVNLSWGKLLTMKYSLKNFFHYKKEAAFNFSLYFVYFS